MKITIEVLDSGHLIEVVDEEGVRRHCCGKWHAVATILKGYLYKKEVSVKKKTSKKTRKKKKL